MAGSELRAALEQRLGALAIRTEVVEHPEVRLRPQEGRGSSAAAETQNRGAGGRRASVYWVQAGTYESI